MSFFKKLFTQKKSYKKYGDVLKNQITTKEQRMEAIETLENLPVEQAVPELLKRFEIVIESGLQDSKEKEYCSNIIAKHGEAARPYVLDYIQTKKRLAWVIRIAEKIFPQKDMLDLLFKNLQPNIVEFDDDTMERNLDILHALKEFKDSAITKNVSVFLENRDDDTRLAALECLEIQAEIDPAARKIILNLAQNPTNDINSRFMGAVTQIVNSKRWSKL